MTSVAIRTCGNLDLNTLRYNPIFYISRTLVKCQTKCIGGQISILDVCTFPNEFYCCRFPLLLLLRNRPQPRPTNLFLPSEVLIALLHRGGRWVNIFDRNEVQPQATLFSSQNISMPNFASSLLDNAYVLQSEDTCNFKVSFL